MNTASPKHIYAAFTEAGEEEAATSFLWRQSQEPNINRNTISVYETPLTSVVLDGRTAQELSLAPSGQPLDDRQGKLGHHLSTESLTYSTHLDSQKAQGTKWLDDINLEPYLSTSKLFKGKSKASSAKEFVEKAAEKQGLLPKSHRKDQMLEELLPTNNQSHLTIGKEFVLNRSHKDTFFSALYIVSMLIFLIVGFAYVFSFPNEMRKELIRSSSLYRAFVDSINLFSVITLASLTASAIWVFMIRKYTAKLIWGIVIFIPAALFGMSVWLFVSSFTGTAQSASQDNMLIILSIAMFISGVLYLLYVRSSQRRINTTIRIAGLAATILSENPLLFPASIAFLLTYAAFISIWVAFFAHALLIGRVENSHWILTSGSYWLQAYFLFILVWTTCVWTNVQRSTIGGVVAQWYFRRHEPNYSSVKAIEDSFKIAVTTSLGQIAFGSILLTGVNSVRFTLKPIKKAISKPKLFFLAPLLAVFTFMMAFIEKTIEHLTVFSLYYVALKGESFIASGRAVSRIFRRNLLTSYMNDYLSNALFFITTLTTALISGLATYVFAVHVLGSEYGLSVSLLFSTMAWYLLQFFANLMSDTMDAALLCYALDLDSEMIRCEAAHEAFTASRIEEN